MSAPLSAVKRALIELPTGPGLYVWWAEPVILPGLNGPTNDADPTLRLL